MRCVDIQQPTASACYAVGGAQLWASPISIEEIWRGLRPGEESVAGKLINALRIVPIDRTAAM
jgi:hypothetical protein